MAGGPAEAQAADITVADLTPESLGLEVCSNLALKGFCVVAPFVGQDILDRAVAEAGKLSAEGRWTKVNNIIQEGLLGVEGSSQVAELTPPTGEDDERALQDGETLVQLDYAMTQFGFMAQPCLDELGLDVSHRTAGLVHQCGEENELPEPLTEVDCAKWQKQFLRHKLMVCVFIGPGPGTLRLKPYETEHAEVHAVELRPGSTVVLRPDLMSHVLCSEGTSLSMSTFFLQGHLQRCAPGVQQMTPSARLLDDWTLGRLKQLKEEMSSDSVWSPELPRDWQTAMNHLFHKGQMISITGSSCRTPLCQEPDGFSKVQLCGVDTVAEVPLSRWDHQKVYDADPESYRYGKVYCRHASFMEGVELFDNKVFGLSTQEARAIDPHQRQILEVGYEALRSAGFKKNTLINKFCGLYLGHGNAEWQFTEKPQEQGVFGATGTALSIAAGRFSFTLGLKGPSMTVDTEGSSGATAVYLGAENLQQKAGADDRTVNDMSLAIGLRVLLCPVWWSSTCAGGWMSHKGRCFAFDSSADGYVYSDGAAAVVMKPLADSSGKGKDKAGEPIGTIAGAMMRNNGRGATLSAPHGPAQQETMVECIRNAFISPFDVDAVETHGSGHDLGDAIEVGSILRVHRSEDAREPVSLSSVKTAVGNGVESGGIVGLLRTMLSFWSGAMPPNLHLRQLNPHMDFDEQPCSIVSECCSYRMQSMFAGNLSQGFGGSNVYVVSWGRISDDRLPQQQQHPAGQVSFWPGGGGELLASQIPASGYSILGSWSGWEEPAPMAPESEGVFGCTVTLGVNRWECFQILLDGDRAKLLHPGAPKASKGLPVRGPPEDAEAFRDCAWMIDGRGEEALPGDEAASPEAAAPALTGARGRPGDRYRVRLHVRGKWRNVTWEKLPPAIEEAAGPAEVPTDTGKYYLAGSFNNWAFEEMEAAGDPGNFSVEIRLPVHEQVHGGEFLLVRDGDWSQAIFPSFPLATAAAEFEVLGPDDAPEGLLFCIEAGAGPRLRVDFQRKVGLDSDLMSVQWRSV